MNTDVRNQLIIILLLIVTTFLLLFSFRADFQTSDSVCYAYVIENITGKSRLFPSHHLLFIPIMRLFYTMLAPFCEFCNAILVGQIHSIVWAIVTITSFYWLTRHITRSTPAGILGTLFLLVSRGFWEYATQVHTYTPALGCLSLFCTLLFVQGNRPLSLKKSFFLSFLLALAIFYHQGAAVFLIPLGYYLFTLRKKKGLHTAPFILLYTSFIVGCVYLLIFFYIYSAKAKTIGLFFTYVLKLPYLRFNPIVASFNHFGIPGLQKMLSSQLRALICMEKPISILKIVLSGILFTILSIWNMRSNQRKPYEVALRRFLVAWLLVYFLFFLWLYPSRYRFFVLTLFPLLLLLILSWRDIIASLQGSTLAKRIITAGLFVFLVFIFTINFSRRILPRHQSKGYAYTRAKQLAKYASKKCIIVQDFSVIWNLRYYFNFPPRHTVNGKRQIPFIFFHYGLPLSKSARSIKNRCTIMLLRFALPRYAFYWDKKINGYAYPKQWLKQIKWLFDFKYVPARKCFTHRQFKVFSDDEGTRYIFLKMSRKRTSGIKDLFDELDKKIGAKKRIFRKWYAKFDYLL